MAVYAPICDQIVVGIGIALCVLVFVDRLVQLGLSLANVVYQQTMVSPRACVGAGSVVMAGCHCCHRSPVSFGRHS